MLLLLKQKIPERKKPDKTDRYLNLLPYPAYHFFRMICPPSKRFYYTGYIFFVKRLNSLSFRNFITVL